MAQARPFDQADWKKIRELLQRQPERYGLPRREYGSVLLGSFNIRKLGNPDNRSDETWQFLADICCRFDLLAVQEIMEDLRGISRLKQEMGPEFAMAISDATGAFPGEAGVAERLGFIYNWRSARRGEVATDISYDRSKLFAIQLAEEKQVSQAFRDHLAKLDEYQRKLDEFERQRAAGEPARRPTKPSLKMPVFLSFIRTPYMAAFEIVGHPSSKTYRLMAINAHLIFGESMTDRRLEFDALMDWIIARVKEDSEYYKNFVLLGDLNLKFDKPERDRPAIERHLKTFDNRAGQQVRVVFPFLDPHPSETSVFRTNARLDETFDQIGLFYKPQDLPPHLQEAKIGENTRLGPDYGMFNFVQLFSEALRGKPFEINPTDATVKKEQQDFLARFEHEVSDHMPIWVRFPLFEAPLLERPESER